VTDDDRNELLAAVDLPALFGELAGPRARNGGWPCPNPALPQSGRTPPVSVDGTKGLWKCFGCGVGGTAIDLVKFAHSVETREAFEYLRARVGKQRPPRRRSPRRSRSTSTLSPHAAEVALDTFCAGRGWDRAVADRFGLHAVRDRWGEVRIRFPYRDDGRVGWWQDRALGDAKPKWLSPGGRQAILYAPDLARTIEHAQRTGHIIVLEGPADVLALGHAYNLHGVVALPGGALPVRVWAAMLAELNVALLVDSDGAGERLRAAADAVFPPGRLCHVRLPSPLIEDVDHLRQLVGHDDDDFRDAVAELFDVTVDDLVVAPT
jgi:DNA primase